MAPQAGAANGRGEFSPGAAVVGRTGFCSCVHVGGYPLMSHVAMNRLIPSCTAIHYSAMALPNSPAGLFGGTVYIRRA